MHISQQVAQSIVQETQAITKQNINFMDHNAKIIASMDFERIGDFHEGAREVLRTENKVIISTGEEYEGAKPGINLPVRLNHQVVGVIGITGNPSEVNQLGELLKKMTEILIKEAYLDDQVELEKQARETFINEWVHQKYEDEKLLATRGWMFGINIHKPRVAVVLELAGFQEYWYERMENAEVDMKEEVHLQRYRRDIEHLITQHFPERHEHLLIPDGSSRYILLLSINPEDEKEKKKNKILFRLSRIKEALDLTYRQKIVIGIGGLCTNPEDMWKSLEEAERSLQYASDHDQNLSFFDDLGVESFMYDLPASVRQDFVERILKPDQLMKIPDSLETMKVFFQCRGSVTEAAQMMHIHKNTLQYRLKKIAELTGYDPRDIKDSTLLQVAVSFYRINKKTS
ncbi:CdaR family transcriptional regulator [Halobacillus yeomjeoni]|uniref:Helix-turn-helix domain-containing protein n=1 Tax=Halobacillus yeomjeoni TaxID=311194 RepID=A0A931MU18_9BACI|nr:sugar diacid recognition domain-containing protein [Halobacillus yeomjeoni]MBH0229423.1 helix-turn-helix domain-containing protein [Halobacillus yeomjeoni]